jgi:uncharacterized membrane protein
MENKDKKTLIIILGIVVVLLLFGGFEMRNYGMIGGFTLGFMILGWIFSILIIILIVAGIYWLYNNVDFDQIKMKKRRYIR